MNFYFLIDIEDLTTTSQVSMIERNGESKRVRDCERQRSRQTMSTNDSMKNARCGIYL